MSKLTICNYCKLKNIKEDAKETNSKVKIKPDIRYKGILVFVYKENEQLDESEDSKHFYAWFMTLTDHCCC